MVSKRCRYGYIRTTYLGPSLKTSLFLTVCSLFNVRFYFLVTEQSARSSAQNRNFPTLLRSPGGCDWNSDEYSEDESGIGFRNRFRSALNTPGFDFLCVYVLVLVRSVTLTFNLYSVIVPGLEWRQSGRWGTVALYLSSCLYYYQDTDDCELYFHSRRHPMIPLHWLQNSVSVSA
jgi:hypothetical protein